MHLVGFIIRVFLLVRANYFPNVVKVSSQQHAHVLLLIFYKHHRNLKVSHTVETSRFATEVEIKIQAQALPFTRSFTKNDKYCDKTKPKVTRCRACQYLELEVCIGPSVGLLTVWRLTTHIRVVPFIYSFKKYRYWIFWTCSILSVFSLKNAVCFTMITCLVPVLFTFYIQGVLKLKEK